MRCEKTAWLVATVCVIFFLAAGCAKTAPLTESGFRDRALAFLRDTYPHLPFETGDQALVITSGNAQLGLENLYDAYRAGHPDEAGLAAMFAGHFNNIMPQVEEAAAGAAESSPAEVLLKVKPQLTVKNSGGPDRVVYGPVGEDLEVAFVVDYQGAVRFVDKPLLADLGIPLERLYEIALQNLTAASQDLDVRASSEGTERFIAVLADDGFAAARILVPFMQETAFRQLGEPFHAIMPNRDTLLLWSAANPASFTDQAKANALLDYQTRPYPLSGKVFMVDRRGIREKD